MENRAENLHGVEISKKPRSLDLRSFYSNVDSRPRSKRRARTGGGCDERKLEKKSRTDFSSINCKSVNRNCSKSIEEVYNGCLSASSNESKSVFSQGSNRSCGFINILKGLNDATANMPRRKRDFVGRRKVKTESSGVVKNIVEGDYKDVTRRLASVDEKAECSKAPPNVSIEVVVDHGNCEVASDKPVVATVKSDCLVPERCDVPNKPGGEEHSAENTVQSPVKTSFRKRSRKRKVVSVAESVASEFVARDASSTPAINDIREDEENLEENAARMLSSRFDPSCTGFSNRKINCENGGTLKFPSGKKHAKSSKLGNKVIPRKGPEKDCTTKVRRNYYRIFGDLDAYWAMNRRIKVFWPLDRSWYYGHVDNYDDERKLHHVKYDDRDEEWIDLQNERYKLLLLPSEVPGRSDPKLGASNKNCGKEFSKQKSNSRKKRVLSTENGNHSVIDADCEPIITWLSRSSAKDRPSPVSSLHKKKYKGGKLSPASTPPSETFDTENAFDTAPLHRNKSELSVNHMTASNSVRKEYFDDACNSTHEKKVIVYYRKRHRKTKGSILISPKTRAGSLSNLNVGAVLHVGNGSYDTSKSATLEYLESVIPFEALWVCTSYGMVKFNALLMESRNLNVKHCFSVNSAFEFPMSTDKLRLLRMSSTSMKNTLICLWPSVDLEICFVDSILGSIYFMFKGTLNQVVAFVCVVLTAFNSKEQKMFADFQFPGTFIQFKFSCTQNCKKLLVFAFCSFNVIEHPKWWYLNYKFRKSCYRFHELPLTNCSRDKNSKADPNHKCEVVRSTAMKDSRMLKVLKKSESYLSLSSASIETIVFNSIQPCRFGREKKSCPLICISFTTAPAFFLRLHFKLLMERSVRYSVFHDCVAVGSCSPISSTDPRLTLDDGHTSMEVCSNDTLSGIANGLAFEGEAHCFLHGEFGEGEACSIDVTDREMTIVGSTNIPAIDSGRIELLQLTSIDEKKSDIASNGEEALTIILPSEKSQMPAGKLANDNQSTELWNMSGSIIPSPNPTARRSTWQRNRSNSASFGYLHHGWSDVRGDFFQKDFGSGPKKPRTQVSYTSSNGGIEYGTKNKTNGQKRFHRRIRTLNEKRYQDEPKRLERNFESLCCEVNVLVTHADRGWRECGAHVSLELFEHNEWKLAVKVSGCTKYLYKAHQFLQPGTTNRFTHSMMWKGGKDWVLEFTDRSQWVLFKEMHEECYHRNIRAASVKNIPIPGVSLIDENDENGAEVPFYRSLKYFRQVETDVEIGLNGSRVVYDMDSEDEEWVKNEHSAFESANYFTCEAKEAIFERAIDRLEKAAYSQQRDHFTDDDIVELMADLGSVDLVKNIHFYWHKKRQRKGMSLIRYLQPPLWEKYHQEVKAWELALTKNTSILNGRHEKVAISEKPPMFAFCLKPRGLEVPNKGSKHRSHRRISVSGQNNFIAGDHDVFHSFGRRSNGFCYGDERYAYDSHEESPQDSAAGAFCANGDRLERNHYYKLNRSKSKKIASVNDGQSSYPHRRSDNRYAHEMMEIDTCEFSRLYTEQPEDADEYRFRSASGTARLAVNLAKLKRERAQRLLYRADLAIHKAVGALMTAEAMKASLENVNSSG